MMRRSWIPVALSFAVAACGGSDDDRDAGTFVPEDAQVRPDAGEDTPDVGFPDSGTPDAGFPDSGEPDAGFPDSGEPDGGEPDGGEPDGGEPDGGEPDGGVVDPVMQLEAVRNATPGVLSPALPVTGAWVTYIRPAIGNDPAGFFVQASMMGPALFVAVDPATLSPAPNVGDAVAFEVTETTVDQDQIRALAITNFAVIGSGNDVTTLVQDLSAATDVVANLNGYSTELVTITGDLTGAYRFAGSEHRQIQIATMGLPMEPDLTFRVVDSLIEPLGLLPGCTVQVGPTPLWRFRDTAQVSAWARPDVTVLACAVPLALEGATATSPTTVALDFNRPVDPATASAAQFTLSPAATVQSVAVTDDIVTLTTATLADFATYTVTVGGAVTDDLGNAIDPAADSATFVAPGNASTPANPGDLVITEILQNAAGADDGKEWFEIYNPTSTVTYNLFGCDIADQGADNVTVGQQLPIPPMTYITVGTSTDGVGSHGFTPDLMLSTSDLQLSNGSDEVLIRCGGTIIDLVAYDNGATFPDPNGASMSLDPGSTTAALNDIGGNWCEGSTVYAPNALGTPGTANPACAQPPVDAGVMDGGMDGGVVDSGTPDAGVDAGVDAGTPGQQPTTLGAVIFTEVLQNPGGSDTDREWFELYNTDPTQAFDLANCRFDDLGSDSATVTASLVVPPQGFATVAISVTGSVAHGFTPDYVVDNTDPNTQLFLGNSADELILICSGVEIDRVEWDNGATFPDPSGATMNLDPGAFDYVLNDLGPNWCEALTTFSTGDRGTPGVVNDSCAVVLPDAGVIDSGSMMDAGAAMDAGTPMDAGTGGITGLVINEVDYDQPSSDTAEFLELYNAGTATIDLTDVLVVTVNGSNGTNYGDYILSGTLAPGEYFVLANTGVTVPAGVASATLPSNGLQNGAPDGIAVIQISTGAVLDVLSYEGSITAANITTASFTGTVNLVEGTPASASDSGAGSMVRIPNGTDTDTADADWTTTATPTPGLANLP